MKYPFRIMAAVVMATASVLPMVRPSLAAEEVIIAVGSTEVATLPVTELATYAETGTAEGQLQSLLSLLSTDQAQEFRNSLSCEVTVNPEPFGEFLESRLGTLLLTELSQVLKSSDDSVSSLEALRTAMTTSAEADGRVSILSVVQSYPTDQIILDQQTAQGRFDLLESLGEDAKLLMAALDLQQPTTAEISEVAEELTDGFCVTPTS
ncbi:alpha/beta hydrolase [Synechococcales cyanobacterium C]|uniref:Alpha/beta hydrolase n=1 Tax=Petrachloros mirabilis ULC683 TaxID=2781853 RepID=A0A8K1ZXQ2_9CYAN|nr:alpha/beta hydrolase [Petrachloros mirabilis]NCJ05792.1 alpha/beta hydrolase [Petrachloros mirabilis ULC683]